MGLWQFDLSKEDYEKIFEALNVLADFNLGIDEEAERQLYLEYKEKFEEGV